MIFSLFETHKPDSRIQLKNSDKVVIGSGTDLEKAFNIGNFMNMLYRNIENEDVAMTNEVVSHNLQHAIESLVQYCSNNTDDVTEQSGYLFGKKQVFNWMHLIIEEIDSRKKLEQELSNVDSDTKNQMREIIDLSIKSSYAHYNLMIRDIVWLFEDYFEYI